MKLWLLFAMVSLSLAVLNWGLQYKMSLYQETPGQTHASVAKLWTGSKTAAQVNPASVALSAKNPVVLHTSFLVLLPALTTWRPRPRAANTWKPHLDKLQEPYFFRPPPPAI